jgi:hypothetical protein
MNLVGHTQTVFTAQHMPGPSSSELP